MIIVFPYRMPTKKKEEAEENMKVNYKASIKNYNLLERPYQNGEI